MDDHPLSGWSDPWLSPGSPVDDTPIYLISVVSELTGLHPQTLRQYDRVGLVTPGRAPGRGRRYSGLDLARLRRVVELTGDGVNLEGARRILQLEEEVARLRGRLGETPNALPGAHDNLPVLASQGSTALVLWRRDRRVG